MLYKTYNLFLFIDEVVHNRECILSPPYIFLGASFFKALTKDDIFHCINSLYLIQVIIISS